MDPMGDFVLWIVESSTGNLQRKKWIPSDPSESVFWSGVFFGLFMYTSFSKAFGALGDNLYRVFHFPNLRKLMIDEIHQILCVVRRRQNE